MSGGHAEILFDFLEPWRTPDEAVPILLSGMVGSREGWFDAGYCAVPTDLATLARACRAPIDDHREVRVIPASSSPASNDRLPTACAAKRFRFSALSR